MRFPGQSGGGAVSSVNTLSNTSGSVSVVLSVTWWDVSHVVGYKHAL